MCRTRTTRRRGSSGHVLGCEQHHAAGSGGISSVGIISASENPGLLTETCRAPGGTVRNRVWLLRKMKSGSLV